ncbi:serine-type endopeptidase inhibitors [Striga hermonthica]|uniref:Serine-type endopeptidase inhibitors n=1 Tax=Striga hermonthica TaxID=68872 RepID=A0A9N7RF42_STRHE|nr:serine-type endopeptidase inhibitors [Striga hermonthica]
MGFATRVWSFTLLLFGLMLVMAYSAQSARPKICPLYCIAVDAYMICPGSNEKLEPVCNCCLARLGCKIYRNTTGDLICTAT